MIKVIGFAALIFFLGKSSGFGTGVFNTLQPGYTFTPIGVSGTVTMTVFRFLAGGFALNHTLFVVTHQPRFTIVVFRQGVVVAGQAFLPAPTMFYQWHAETFEIPAGAIHLAGSSSFPGQAYVYNNRIFGIEFHPEMTRQMIDRWCSSETGSSKLSLCGAQDHKEQLKNHDLFASASKSWLDQFLDGPFLSGSNITS